MGRPQDRTASPFPFPPLKKAHYPLPITHYPLPITNSQFPSPQL
ncbi:MAG: alpha/beta hydrolase [Tolypothrix carrinoi HA7290-LM1]|nr:alpha/beta hydrolase [Tolypothrix carrinoi HA7290-LM1]